MIKIKRKTKATHDDSIYSAITASQTVYSILTASKGWIKQT